MATRPPAVTDADWEDEWEDVPVGAALSKAEGISQVPDIDKPMSMFMPGMPYGPKLPFSPLQAMEALPGAGGGAGAVIGGRLGGPAGGQLGASVGAGAGEMVRQLLRRISGYAPATGMLQEKLDLDPKSAEAALFNILTEASLGGAGEALTPGKAAAEAMRTKGLKVYAGGLAPKTKPRALKEVMNRLKPIEAELPTGTTNRIARKAAEKTEEVGEEVGRVYGAHADEPSSYKPAQEVLEAKREKLIETQGKIALVPDPVTGKMREEWVPPVVPDDKLWEAFNRRVSKLRSAEYRRGLSGVEPDTGAAIAGGPITTGDVFARRKTVGEQIKRQQRKAFQIGAPTKELSPTTQAAKAERKALSQTLHGELPGTTAVPGGKEVDDLFTAWSTVKEGEPGSSHFLARWAASRLTPGGSISSTLAGVIANQSMLWRSSGNKALRGMAAALEAGDKAKFIHLLRGLSAPEASKEKQ